jgi:putative DNA-invertase from lambdoid prophage Rac
MADQAVFVGWNVEKHLSILSLEKRPPGHRFTPYICAGGQTSVRKRSFPYRGKTACPQIILTGFRTGGIFWTAYSYEIDHMPRTFAYVRVSTTGQTTENQIQEIEAAGFQVEPHRIITETVSGNTAIAQRRGFSRLMDKLESGDILIVTKLDRLGRDAIDVSTTVKALAEIGVRVYCLALGGADLTSSAGTMTMNVLNAVAQFERDLLVERTQSGLKRAKSEGKALGRPSTLNDKQKQDVRDDLSTGMSVSAIARKFVTSRQTIMRIRDEGSPSVRP